MRSWLGEFDRRIVFLTTVLLVLGAVLIHGASAYVPGAPDPDAVGSLPAHLMRVGLGVLACLFASQVDYRTSARYAEFGLLVSVIALLMVSAGTYAFGNEGIQRWLSIGGVRFQPAELAKICLVIALPGWIDRDPTRLRSGWRSWAPLVVPPLVVGALIVAQPNYGTALALCLVVAIVLFVGGLSMRWVVGGVSFLAAGAWFAFLHYPKLQTRFETWVNVFLREQQDLGAGYQSYNAIMGLGNGHWIGVRPGEGIMRFSFVPESDSDFVFAVAGEQMGFAGSLLVVLAYMLLAARALKIARAARDGQAYLTAIAIASMIGVYAFLNIGMVSGLIPVMGLPLPFVSWGGTAMLTNLIAVGVLLNIARNVRRPRRADARWEAVRP